MNEIKIYLRPSGSLAYLYKDFDLYEGCYRNSQLTVFVPKSLLYENENGTFVNLVKTGAILTAPNGSKLTTKSYYLDYEREQTIGGVEFSVYTMITPKEFCVYAGTQTVVVNVESVDNTDQTNPTILSATTTQTATLIVQESAYLGQDEPIEPTELEKIKATLTEIQGEINDLPNKYVTVDTNQTISGNKTHTGINTFNGFTSINGVGIDADAIVKGSDRFKYPVKSGTLALTSDIPENIVTTDTDQTIDGTKAFTSPITVGGQTWHTVYMKDSFVYTVDGNNYEVTYPEKSGLMALKSDIPTDYVTQGQLAQTNQNVEDLYTILEQAQVVTVTTLEQAYTARETADGENIVDGVQTTVKEIQGKTVATENLIPYPYSDGMSKTINGVTFTVNDDGSVTANGTATVNTDFSIGSISVQTNSSYFLSGCPSTGSTSTYIIYAADGVNGYADIGAGRAIVPDSNNLSVAVRVYAEATVNGVVFRPMLNEGTEAKPYSKWFAGLKNASFEKIVSTGRNLIPYPYADGTVTRSGITFTNNGDGSVTTNGTATADAYFRIVLDLPISKGDKYFLSGCPSGGANNYALRVESSFGIFQDVGNGAAFTAADNKMNLYIRVYTGKTVNNIVFRPMLNYGTSALPYEPYISDTFSAETPIELPEYDVAYPETGETKRQSNTIVFDGTEYFGNYSTTEYYIYTASINPYGFIYNGGVANNGFIFTNPNPDNEKGCYIAGYQKDRFNIWFKKTVFPEFDTLDKFKSWLTAQYAAGDPLTVTYKTAEATTEATPFDKSKYIAWKNGSETIDQGSTDNSEYGAEDTVKQDYFTLTGGTTNV